MFISLYKFVSYGDGYSTIVRRQRTGVGCLILMGSSVPKRKCLGMFQELMRSFWVLCLQVLNNSFLLFKVADSGLKMI